MQLITFSQRNRSRLGRAAGSSGQEYVLIGLAWPDLPTDLVEFSADRRNRGSRRRRQALASPDRAGLTPRAEVTLLARSRGPARSSAWGTTTTTTWASARPSRPEFPTFFCKTANTIIGPGKAIVIPRVTNQVDYEAELAVVIGKRAGTPA